MSLKLSQKVHFKRFLTDRAVCGVKLDGWVVRHTHIVSDVTCKRCLKYLKNVCVCEKCGWENKLTKCEYMKHYKGN
jgi:hypothetical protein